MTLIFPGVPAVAVMIGGSKAHCIPCILFIIMIKDKRTSKTPSPAAGSEKSTPPLMTRASLPNTVTRPGQKPRSQSPLASPASSLTLDLKQRNSTSPMNSSVGSPTVVSPSVLNSPGVSSQEDSFGFDIVDVQGSETKKGQRKNKKAQCPCGKSSGGQSWNIPCYTCKQVWHNSCAGLKADFTQPVLNSLTKSWQCPWCFCCPFPRPPNHVSAKSAKELGDRILTADFIQELTESVAETMKLSDSAYKVDIAGIKSQLDSLSQNIQELHENRPQPCQIPGSFLPGSLSIGIEPPCLDLKSNENPISDHRTDYLNPEEAGNVYQLLKTLKEKKLFKNKNGHSTVSYGEQYGYAGSNDKPTSKEMPVAIKSIINKISKDYNLQENEIPNSVLINHFPQKVNARDAKSSLPKHSDDEVDINPDSAIYTYSVGGPRNITFSANFSDEIKVHEALDNTMYVMTRKSQAWYKHEILDAEKCEERFSVTLRHINKCNRRSILMIGDSNTKNIKFGSGKGTVGEKYPGKRIKAAKIHQIDPSECVGYSNIVIACGTNDLRPTEVTGPLDTYVYNLVNTLKSKIEEINALTQTKIFVMPVPPTRDQNMNRNIVAYNGLLMKSEFVARYNVWIPGIYSFLDRSGMLSSNLTRGGDPIHFGEKGICMFIKTIKDSVYHRERVERRPWMDDTNNHTGGSRKPP